MLDREDETYDEPHIVTAPTSVLRFEVRGRDPSPSAAQRSAWKNSDYGTREPAHSPHYIHANKLLW